jgi:hypothetical protein
MATSSLVHFGVDSCFRLPVLRSAGFRISECDVLDELPIALASDPDAIVLEEEPQFLMEQAIALTRLQSTAPLIVFASETLRQAPPVDLVIRPLTTPEMWLWEIESLIARCQQLRAEAREIRQASAALFRSVAATRQASRETREQSVHQREKMRRLLEMRKRSME